MTGKRDVEGPATSDHLDDGSSVVKRVRLTRKTCPGRPVHVKPEPGLLLPDSSGAGREVGVPRNLFPRLGIGSYRCWGCLEPDRSGSGVVVLAVQSSRRDECTRTGPFMRACTRLDKHARVHASSEPPPPQPQHTTTTIIQPGEVRCHRRRFSTPLWGVESCSLPSR